MNLPVNSDVPIMSATEPTSVWAVCPTCGRHHSLREFAYTQMDVEGMIERVAALVQECVASHGMLRL